MLSGRFKQRLGCIADVERNVTRQVVIIVIVALSNHILCSPQVSEAESDLLASLNRWFGAAAPCCSSVVLRADETVDERGLFIQSGYAVSHSSFIPVI